RKGLSELLGEREVVAHYSKKGYQLRIRPVYQQVDTGAARRPPRWWLAVLALGSLALAAGGWLLWQGRGPWLEKSHRLVFERLQGYTSEVGHERAGTPHPREDILAYVRQRDTGGSQLVVRDAGARDWIVAESGGNWQQLE